MLARHALLAGVGLDITTRAGEKIRLQVTHPLFEVDMGHMTPATAREVAKSLVIAADIIESNAGAGGQALTSPQRTPNAETVAAMAEADAMAAARKQSGRVNWAVLSMLGALAVVWGCVGYSAAHWAGLV